jgi:hypothetical protein
MPGPPFGPPVCGAEPGNESAQVHAGGRGDLISRVPLVLDVEIKAGLKNPVITQTREDEMRYSLRSRMSIACLALPFLLLFGLDGRGAVL